MLHYYTIKKREQRNKMPRRPRVDMVGTYHIVNRGVDRRVIYKDDEDHKTFL